MTPEGFIAVPSYENLYSVNEQSLIWSHRSGKCLTQTNLGGYLAVRLYRDGLATDWMVHRIMALAFLGFKIVPQENGKRGNQPIVDHIDRNKNNNVLSNLRMCTYSQNRAWGKKQKTKSNLRGVYPKPSGRFQVMIRVNDKLRSIGYFSDPIEGAKAYDVEALKAFGEFANLNFPQ